VIDTPALGEDWRRVDQRTWRTGHQTPTEPWARRAASAGALTAWRSFRSGERWLWVQVTNLANPGDAVSVLPTVGERFLSNPRSEVSLVHEDLVTPPEVEGAAASWGLRQVTEGPSGRGLVLLWGYAVGATMLVLSAAGTPDWTTSELHAIAARQAALMAS